MALSLGDCVHMYVCVHMCACVCACELGEHESWVCGYVFWEDVPDGSASPILVENDY